MLHRGTTLTAVEAVHILFPDTADPAATTSLFRESGEVRTMLAEHFSYDPVLHTERQPPPGDVEVLLYALDVGSLEELRDLVQAGRQRKRMRLELV